MPTIAILLACIMFTFCISDNLVIAQTNQTTSLQVANDAVEQAFEAILDAETAGANVTILLSDLNDATDLLVRAQNAYQTGDTDTSTIHADAAISIAQQIETSALTAKEDALATGQLALLSTVVITIVASIVFVFLLFFFWRLFRRRYINSLLDAKPEVITQ